MTRRGRNLWSSGVRSGQLGSISMPTASRARGFNPGHAPLHRGTAVTPPGLGRENPGDLGGRYALQVGVAPHSNAQKAPQGVKGEMRPVSSAGRCLSLPRGLGVVFPRALEVSKPQPQPRRFLPEFTIVAGGSRLSHAQPAAPVASEQAKNRQFVPHP